MFKYVGGKYYMLKHIVPLIDAIPHRTYVEPFGGSGKVLLAKKPSEIEIWNDLDENVYAIWTTVKYTPMEFVRALCKTEYSRENFDRTKILNVSTELERAIKYFILFQQSMNAKKVTWYTGSESARGISINHSAWLSGIQKIPRYSKRIQNVDIHNKPYDRFRDDTSTLWYLDPPYVQSTRAGTRYKHELTTAQHIQLCKFANSLSGPVIISGYSNPLYEHYLNKYSRVDIEQKSSFDSINGGSVKTKVESLWFSPVAYKYIRH